MRPAVHRGRPARQGHDPDKGNQMMQLPLHPTARDPRTGLRLRALWVDPLGRARYPMLGASPDDPAEGGTGGGGGKTDPPEGGTGAKTDPPQQPQRQAGVPENYAIDSAGASLGYPVNTPVVEMKTEEQAAYHRAQSRKHEQRASGWKQVAGDRTPEQVKADLEELETLRREKMTDQEKREADAEKRGEQKVTSTVSTTFAAQLLGVALAHIDEDRRKVLVEGANLSSFVNSDGTVDADKVTTYAETLAPKSDKDNQRGPDYGAGRRGSPSSSGVAAGRTAFQERQAAKKGRRGITADQD